VEVAIMPVVSSTFCLVAYAAFCCKEIFYMAMMPVSNIN
jgi:hypothetical protein